MCIPGSGPYSTQKYLLEDTTAPVITLIGPAYVEHELFTPYLDPGATATSYQGEPLLVTSWGEVDGDTPGTYTLTYGATDSYGKAASSKTRTVIVLTTVWNSDRD